MVERQCHQKQNFQSLLSRNDFYGDRTFYHITAELVLGTWNVETVQGQRRTNG